MPSPSLVRPSSGYPILFRFFAESVGARFPIWNRIIIPPTFCLDPHASHPIIYTRRAYLQDNH